MGGRGVSAFGGGGGRFGGGGKVFIDDSGIGTSRGIASATNMIVGAFGSESIQKAIDYVTGAMENVTGRENYLGVSITGGATGEGGTYAWMSPFSGEMGLNTDYFKYDSSHVEKTYANDVKSGFHPKGTSYKDVMVHEAAHRLDGVISQKMWDAGGPRTASSTQIVREAINNIKAQRGGKGRALDIQKSLSGYGARYYSSHTGDSYVETFAEAIADYHANGKNANPLSKQIVNITRQYIQRYK